MPVVDAFDTLDLVVQAPLGDVWRRPQGFGVGTRSPSKPVDETLHLRDTTWNGMK